MRTVLVGLILALLTVSSTHAADLRLDTGGSESVLATSILLAHPEAREIAVGDDVAYRRDMRFRAIPMTSLLSGIERDHYDRLEAVALDGFVAQIPLSLLLDDRPGAPQAWLAVEPLDARWPTLSGKSVSAGPFYVVWMPADGIGGELWPYQVAELKAVASPAKRWPQLSPDASLPADSSVWRGAEVFTMQCIACHKLNGGGASDIGPDLNQPHNPYEYFQSDALRQLIRDPRALRHWPEQRMPAFPVSSLSDSDLDALLAYLQQMLVQRQAEAAK
ncbi:MAG: cytochrome c [Lysobacteraceae bacterium]